MSKQEELKVDKARVVLVGFAKEKDKYSFIKALANELGTTFEEANELADEVPVEIIQPLPIQAAENFADRLRAAGAEVEVVPLSRELGGGRTCYRHPHKIAMAKCKVCGRLVCSICLLETKGKFFCEDHFRIFQIKRAVKFFGSIAAVILLSLIWIFYQDTLTKLVGRMLPVSKQRVALIMFSNSSTEQMTKIYTSLVRSPSPNSYQEGDVHGIKDINGWFQKQYETFHPDNGLDVIELDLYGLFEFPDMPPAFGQVSDYKTLKSYFKTLAKENDLSLRAYDYYVFIYLVKNSTEPSDFMEKIGIYQRNMGMLLFPMEKTWSNDYYIMALANLLARMMGASMKLDDQGFPIFPTGYAEPHLTDLYPQPSTELMGCYIPEKRFTIKRINSLDQVVIGAQTAYELGWVSKGMVKKAYSGLQ